MAHVFGPDNGRFKLLFPRIQKGIVFRSTGILLNINDYLGYQELQHRERVQPRKLAGEILGQSSFLFSPNGYRPMPFLYGIPSNAMGSRQDVGFITHADENAFYSTPIWREDTDGGRCNFAFCSVVQLHWVFPIQKRMPQHTVSFICRESITPSQCFSDPGCNGELRPPRRKKTRHRSPV